MQLFNRILAILYLCKLLKSEITEPPDSFFPFLIIRNQDSIRIKVFCIAIIPALNHLSSSERLDQPNYAKNDLEV
jgi:hypothetical protein